MLFRSQTSDTGPGVGTKHCCFSSVVEHFLGKEEVTSSSLVNSSENQRSVMKQITDFLFSESPEGLKKAILFTPAKTDIRLALYFANSVKQWKSK